MSGPKPTFAVFKQWLADLQNCRPLRQARVILCPENNLAWESEHLVDSMHRHGITSNIYFVKDHRGKIGVHTTDNTKQSMVLHMNRLMSEGDPAICFWKHLVGLCIRSGDTSVISYASSKENMLKQMKGFLRIIKKNKDASKPPIISYTGKRGGKDDHLLAFGIAIRAYQKYAVDVKMASLMDLTEK